MFIKVLLMELIGVEYLTRLGHVPFMIICLHCGVWNDYQLEGTRVLVYLKDEKRLLLHKFFENKQQVYLVEVG